MRSSSSTRANVPVKTPALGITKILLAGIGMSILSTHNAFSQSQATPAAEPAPASTSVEQSDAQSREGWRKTMSRVKLPKKGCFKASYPTTKWEEVPCGSPSPYPNQTARGSYPDAVGAGTDYEAQVSGLISSAVGEFPTVSPSTVTETGKWGSNAAKANAFTLQVNTQLFTTSACAGGVSGCKGWQQFIFSQNQCSSGPCVFMEYTLDGYYTPGSSCYSTGTCCPSGSWMTDGANDGNCYYNSSSGNRTAGVLTAAELQGAALMGTAAGGTDTVVLLTTSGDATAMAADSVLNLDQAWTTTEFNVFGDCCGSEANFSPGTTIVVGTTVLDGITKAPSCVSGGLTAETNNLTLVKTSAIGMQPFPTILFTESNTLSTAEACATAAGYAASLSAIIDFLL